MRRRRSSTLRNALAICCLLTVAALASCVKLPRQQTSIVKADTVRADDAGVARVNINRASEDELERLPGVGPALARRIVEHRERHGPFRRTEHLLIVRGVSDTRFRELRPLIAVD